MSKSQLRRLEITYPELMADMRKQLAQEIVRVFDYESENAVVDVGYHHPEALGYFTEFCTKVRELIFDPSFTSPPTPMESEKK